MSFDLNSCMEFINRTAENFKFTTHVINAFRFLRNLCASNPEIQNKITQDPKIVKNCETIFQIILCNEKYDNEEYRLCLIVGLQFLGNLIVNNKNNQLIIWSVCKKLLDNCILNSDRKIKNCSLMILYNILLNNPTLVNELPHSFETAIKLIELKDTLEYAVFVTEFLILNINYLNKFYNQLDIQTRILILNEVQRLVNESNKFYIECEVIHFYATQFSLKAKWILNLTSDNEESLKAIEAVKILEVMVKFSSDDKKQYLEQVQKETSIFIESVVLLKTIHSISKQKGNIFTMINSLSECNDTTNRFLENPVFGFKAGLIRLIGNMCWKNKKNQDIIRDLEGILVILDCCCIDEKNLFIIQWCILAIHNICDGNLENQKVLASVSNKGVIDAKQLQEMGIMLNKTNEGNSLYLMELKKK